MATLRAEWERDGHLTDVQMRRLMAAIDGVQKDHRVFVRAMLHLRSVGPGVAAALQDISERLPDPQRRTRRHER